MYTIVAMKAYMNGALRLGDTIFHLTSRTGSHVEVVDWDQENTLISSADIELIADLLRPAPETKYAGVSQAIASFRTTTTKKGDMLPKR